MKVINKEEFVSIQESIMKPVAFLMEAEQGERESLLFLSNVRSTASYWWEEHSPIPEELLNKNAIEEIKSMIGRMRREIVEFDYGDLSLSEIDGIKTSSDRVESEAYELFKALE